MGALNFAVIWLLMYSLMITFALSLGSLCMNLNTLSPSENTVLLNFTYAKQTVPNYVICGRNCNMDTNCKSFNYYNCNDMCELNNSTRSEHSEAFVDDPNGVYFDENPESPLKSSPVNHYRSCEELYAFGVFSSNNIFTIYPCGVSGGAAVYCDMSIYNNGRGEVNPDDNQGAMITDGSTITTDDSTTTTDDTTTTTDGGKTTVGLIVVVREDDVVTGGEPVLFGVNGGFFGGYGDGVPDIGG